MKEFWIKQSNFRQFHGGANRQGAWSEDNDSDDDWETRYDQGAYDNVFYTDEIKTGYTETSFVSTAAAVEPAAVILSMPKNKFNNKNPTSFVAVNRDPGFGRDNKMIITRPDNFDNDCPLGYYEVTNVSGRDNNCLYRLL